VLDAEKAVAEAMGDKAAVRAIEIEQKTRQIASQLEAQGEDPAVAKEIARQKAELMQLANEINDAASGQMARGGDRHKSIGLGGSAGLGSSVDPQREIAKKQETANKLLGDIKSALSQRTPVMLAEVFD
jgi:DNA-directed RNA polymerase specialized sigma subunit